MSLPRHRLPDRRHHWLYRFECDGQAYTGGIGRFPDGRVSEKETAVSLWRRILTAGH